MPRYYPNKICGYYLYYTSFCIIECMHVHAKTSAQHAWIEVHRFPFFNGMSRWDCPNGSFFSIQLVDRCLEQLVVLGHREFQVVARAFDD